MQIRRTQLVYPPRQNLSSIRKAYIEGSCNHLERIANMTSGIMRAAVHNIAAWCDAGCCGLGGDTAFEYGLWVNRHLAPPFYSNAITLNPDDTAAQLAGIRALFDAGLSGAWSVKDSFCTLDLSALGFRVLF